MEIQLSSIIIQMLNFGLVVFVIAKFVYKPIVKILKQRTEKIEQSQLEAEKSVKQNQEMASKIKTDLASAKKEADKIISQAKKEAEAEAAKIIADAKSQAKQSAQVEHKNMLAAFESEKQSILSQLTELITNTTATILQNALTKDQQHQIIKSQINTIKGVKFE